MDDLLAAPFVADPLRAHDCAPITDGAAVVILAAARPGPRAVRAAGLDHRLRAPDRLRLARGARPDDVAVGGRGGRRAAGAAGVEVAELHAPFTHQEIVLRSALGLAESVRISPSGGALAGNPMFAAGLARIGHAARQIMSGAAAGALGHATSGPALQQNLVCVMEAR